MTKNHFRVPIWSLLAWTVATLFSLLQFFLQISTNLMAGQLMQDFSLTASQLGLLSSIFFYAYIVAQIPAGFLFTRFSTNRLLAFVCLLCGVGCIVFAYSHNLGLAYAGRIMMGFGAGFGFLGLLHVTRHWFTRAAFALMVGISEFIAMTGTGISEQIAGYTVPHLGWRNLMLITGFIAIVISILLGLLIRVEKASQPILQTTVFRNIISQYWSTFSNQALWLAGIYGCGMLAVMTAFSALWGVDFLQRIYHLNFSQATHAISLIFWGLAIGCPVLGWLAGRLQNSMLVMLVSASLVIILTAILSFPFIQYSHLSLLCLLFLIGFWAGTYFLCFDIAGHFVPTNLHSVATSFCSVLVMSGALILQPLMGLLLAHPLTFSINNFQQAMIIMLLFQILALIAIVQLKRKSVT